MEIFLPNNFTPRPDQLPLWNALEAGGKRVVAVCHRRYGKDAIALHWAAVAAHQRPGNYWHMLPEAAQARKAIWDAVNEDTGHKRIDEAFPAAIRSGTRNTDMSIQFKCGSTWQVVGSDNYNSLVGASPVGIVFSEWALADPQAWAYLRPILLRNKGWALFIYTPRGRNHGATMYEEHREDEDWFTFRMPADQSPVFTEQELETELREYQIEFGKDDGESRYRQEYLCDFNVAVVGSYYGALLTEAEEEGRIGEINHMADLKVDTWWDLGISDSTSIWFVQQSFGKVAVIDYYEVSGMGPDHWAAVLAEKREERKFVYGKHYFPHDGASRHPTPNGAMRVDEMMRQLGVTVEIVPRGSNVLDGITRTRQVIPSCWFDRKHCARGIEALRQYRKEWDDQGRTFRPRPLHDWASHGADAFRTGAMASDIAQERPTKPRDKYARQFKRSGTWMSA
jgi:phage terminase large subunit